MLAAGEHEQTDDTEATLTKVLGGTLAIAIIIVIVFAIVPFGTGDSYTEFYVLGQNGTASSYPENVTVGETATVLVGIGNFEHRPQTYTLVVRTNEKAFVTRSITLEPGERWEQSVSLAFDSPGYKRLHLELYIGETTDGAPDRRLRLIVTVRDGTNSGG